MIFTSPEKWFCSGWSPPKWFQTPAPCLTWRKTFTRLARLLAWIPRYLIFNPSVVLISAVFIKISGIFRERFRTSLWRVIAKCRERTCTTLRFNRPARSRWILVLFSSTVRAVLQPIRRFAQSRHWISLWNTALKNGKNTTTSLARFAVMIMFSFVFQPQ